eukprot:5620168-Pleurochrysis_carterae.AAC.5
MLSVYSVVHRQAFTSLQTEAYLDLPFGDALSSRQPVTPAQGLKAKDLYMLRCTNHPSWRTTLQRATRLPLQIQPREMSEAVCWILLAL